MKILYFNHQQIDKQKWDSVIENSQNGLVYALSWFLDIISPNWDALVYGDYEIVMPLTWRNKLGVKYLYQPVFLQQLGIFSKKEITPEIVKNFISEIEKHFKFVDIQLNYANPKFDSDSFILRNTQLIDIVKPYDELFKNYKKNHRKNLQKLADTDFIINSDGTSSDYANLALHMFNQKSVDEITEREIDDLQKIMDLCTEKGLGELYFGRISETICAAAFFLKWEKRVIVYTAMNDEGRKVGAMFGIIDKYIRENAGKDLLFDFAGSNIPGVKYRNLGFGARNEIYYRVKTGNANIL